MNLGNPGICAWCHRMTDHAPMGSHNVHVCRPCWAKRNTPDGPQIIRITEEEIKDAIYRDPKAGA